MSKPTMLKVRVRDAAARGAAQTRVIILVSAGVIVLAALGSWWMLGGEKPTVEPTPPVAPPTQPEVEVATNATADDPIEDDYAVDFGEDAADDDVDVADRTGRRFPRKPGGRDPIDDDSIGTSRPPAAHQPSGLQP